MKTPAKQPGAKTIIRDLLRTIERAEIRADDKYGCGCLLDNEGNDAVFRAERFLRDNPS